MADPTYELTYIVNGVLSDQQISQVVKRVTKLINENGGDIVESDEWGTRRLAYPIRKKRNGYYVNVYFNGPGELIARLERALQIDDDILRYLTLRMDAKMVRHYKQRKIDAKRAKEEAEREARERAEEEARKAAEAAEEEDEEEEAEDEEED